MKKHAENNMMPTLLQINISANYGSTGKIAEAIGASAISNGWESYIVYGQYCNPSESHLIKVGCVANRCIHFAEQRIRDNEGQCSRLVTKKLISKIKEINPDVVHLHNIHDHWLNYPILFNFLNGTDIKVVWTFHDCWAFTGHCMHFVTAKCDRWKTGCYKCLKKGQYPKTMMDKSKENYLLKKNLFQACNNLTIIACSNWMGDFVKESFLKNKRLEIIHNGVDLRKFYQSTANKQSGVFKILAVSLVWNKEKGLYDIYQLRKILPLEFVITIIGLSEEQMRTMPDGINGIQRTQNIQELVELYSTSNVLINPTYADTFPTVNIEALACGTPVITYNTGGSPEAIDEKTGVVVPQGDIEGMAEAIRQMKANPLSSEDCRKRAEECFDKDRCFEKYVEIYDELIS